MVFHTHYTGDDIPNMQARAGANVNDSPDVLVIKNDTPMDRVGLNHAEEMKFDAYVAKIERMCHICGDFLDELVKETGTTGDKKFHIASYLKQYFNNEIKNARSIGNVDEAVYELANFYHGKMEKELAKN